MLNPLPASDTLFQALPSDRRFSFVYSPAPSGTADRPLVIAIHGSDRDVVGMMACLRDGLGNREVSILAPLFPARLNDEDHSDGYKFLVSAGICYLALMQAMIASISAPGGRFGRRYMFGFSGGAQFAQRYGLFCAAELDGLVLAAPGGVTLLDEGVEWWPGLLGAEVAVARPLALPALRRLPVEIIIGDEDRNAGLVARAVGAPHGSAFENLAGNNRVDRARSLHASLTQAGVAAGYHELAGVAHALRPVTLKSADLIARWIDTAEQNNPSRPITGGSQT